MLPLFCVTTGISHRVKLAILVNFPNAVLNAKRFYNKASQAIQSPRTVPFFLLIPLLGGFSFANVHVNGIVALNM